MTIARSSDQLGSEEMGNRQRAEQGEQEGLVVDGRSDPLLVSERKLLDQPRLLSPPRSQKIAFPKVSPSLL